MLVVVDRLVTVVAGVSWPRLRFFNGEVLIPPSSISKLTPEATEDREESSSLRFSCFSSNRSDSCREKPFAEKAWSDDAKDRVCLRGTRSASVICLTTFAVSLAIREVFMCFRHLDC